MFACDLKAVVYFDFDSAAIRGRSTPNRLQLEDRGTTIRRPMLRPYGAIKSLLLLLLLLLLLSSSSSSSLFHMFIFQING